MKMVPDAISLARLLLAPLLLIIPIDQPEFWAVYAGLGTSDILDGWVARRWDCVTKTGAVLDSVADSLFFLVILAVCVRDFRAVILLEHGILLVVILAVRGINLGWTWKKYGRPVFLHTWANKSAGIAAYAIPALLALTAPSPWLTAALVLALGAAGEELLMTAVYNQPDLDRCCVLDRHFARDSGGKPMD